MFAKEVTYHRSERQNLPDQKHDERRGDFVEHGHVDVVLAQPLVPPDHGYQNGPGGDTEITSEYSDNRIF